MKLFILFVVLSITLGVLLAILADRCAMATG